MPFAKSVCVSFPETLAKVPSGKGVLTGSPIREELWDGDASKGLKICSFELNIKPVILAMGGSLGATAINRQLSEIMPRLLDGFNVIHLCGKGNLPHKVMPGYAPFEYVGEELPHLLAAADIVVSRAGANSIFELHALAKPNLLIPLTKAASRGDQLLNAASFERQGYSKVLQEENLTNLYDTLMLLYEARENYAKQMGKSQPGVGVKRVVSEIERWTRKETT
jgi:UDP-N-acetylglucosamine--N-acetylmuramyl-(pentapeptide) pyrophosphoryl-undecaprenol N-acetylglucosamine transferase